MLMKRFNFINIIAVSGDYIEMNFKHGITMHGKRAALIAVDIAKTMDFSEDDISDLRILTLLHDYGINKSTYQKMRLHGRDSIEEDISHCIEGEALIPRCLLYTYRPNIILYSHENFDGSGFFGLNGSGIPQFSQIIKLSSDVEMLYRRGKTPSQIIESVEAGIATKYSPELVEVFKKAQEKVAFYLSLHLDNINLEIKSSITDDEFEMSYSLMEQMCNILEAAVNAKSPFTFKHSKNVSALAHSMSRYYKFDEDKSKQFCIAAKLHDIGKLTVPDCIIDKKGPLTDEEFSKVKQHPYYTSKLLKESDVLENISKWASQHHEKLNGSGYPYGLSERDLCFESQLMSVLDIFEALTDNRPYRKALPMKEVHRIMNSMVDRGELNGRIVRDTLNMFSSNTDAYKMEHFCS
ncbi:MAG: HD-GYP domain-containing protein [Sphaerochaeta sp.]